MYTQEQVDEKVTDLKAKNSEILGDIRQMKDQLAAFAEAGITPERVAAVRQQVADGPDYDAMLEAAKAEDAAELAAKDAEIEKLDQRTDEAFLDRTIRDTLTAAEGEYVLLHHQMERQMQVERLSDGERRVIIVDGEGERRLSKWALGAHDLMTPEQLVAEMKKDDGLKGAFKSAPEEEVEDPDRLVIDASDPLAFGNNLDAIAGGDVDLF